MSTPPPHQGLFITFEGGEGTGKSSLIRSTAEHLSHTRSLTTTAEPGRSSIGPELRHLILRTDGAALTPKTEALLLAADRAQHAHEIIRPALARGDIVLCDRYLDSSIAYQGYARGLSPERISDISLWAADSLLPDHTFLLDLDPEIGLARRYGTGDTNRLDREEITFHQKVRQAYLTMAHHNPERFTILDATHTIEHLTHQVCDTITTLTSHPQR